MRWPRGQPGCARSSSSSSSSRSAVGLVKARGRGLPAAALLLARVRTRMEELAGAQRLDETKLDEAQADGGGGPAHPIGDETSR